jgi:large conductance mechanosensitive channel
MASSSGFVADFKKFLMQGNVVDLAVAVVIGGAFGKVVSSLVENIVMPIVSMVMPGGDWKNAGLVLGKIADPKDPTKTIDNIWKFGAFFASILDFVIIALAIFTIIRLLESAKKRFSRQQAAAEAASPSPETVLQERMANTLDRLAESLERR